MYQNQARAYDIYRNNQVTTAPKKKLLLMLFDGAIKFLTIAEMAIDEKDYQKANTNLQKTQNILTELMITLNFNAGEIAQNLYALYEYMYNKLIHANIHKDKESIIEVKNYLKELRETWEQI